MPVFRQPSLPSAEFGRDKLVGKLAEELEKQGEVGEPLIFEKPVHGSDRFLVVVVWSAWPSIPWGQRHAIILDAYREYDKKHPSDPPKAERITVASGLTWDEADRSGIFPYSITEFTHPEAMNPDEIARAMMDEGGAQTTSGIKLRFVQRETAERTFERLRQRLPSVHWLLNQMVPRVDDE